VSVAVKNCSAIEAEEVIEAYIEPLNSNDAPLNPCLCAFKRVSLAAGTEAMFRLPVLPAAFTVVDERGNRVLPGGPYKIYVGGSQPDPVSVRLTGVKPLCALIP
jgi:beta-glucosidase